MIMMMITRGSNIRFYLTHQQHDTGLCDLVQGLDSCKRTPPPLEVPVQSRWLDHLDQEGAMNTVVDNKRVSLSMDLSWFIRSTRSRIFPIFSFHSSSYLFACLSAVQARLQYTSNRINACHCRQLTFQKNTVFWVRVSDIIRSTTTDYHHHHTAKVSVVLKRWVKRSQITILHNWYLFLIIAISISFIFS